MKRDQQIQDLAETIDTLFAFVDSLPDNEIQTTKLQQIIKLMTQQTLECMLFIQEYCGCGFGGMQHYKSIH